MNAFVRTARFLRITPALPRPSQVPSPLTKSLRGFSMATPPITFKSLATNQRFTNRDFDGRIAFSRLGAANRVGHRCLSMTGIAQGSVELTPKSTKSTDVALEDIEARVNHAKTQFAHLNRNTTAKILPYSTYRATYVFPNDAINFNIYYHYIIASVFKASVIIFRYFDRGLLELLGPYGLSKSLQYLAFRVEMTYTGFIPHYFFYTISTLLVGMTMWAGWIPGWLLASGLYLFAVM